MSEVALPMHLTLVLERLRARYYRHAAAVTSDLRLIASDCELYNGSESALTRQAYKVVALVISAIESAVSVGVGGGAKGSANKRRR